jgi:ATP-dependent DNA helicase PIF1
MSKSQNKPSELEFNQQFKYALEIIENSPKNIFITGRAGTGKSTLLDYFRRTTKKKVVVLAPTGVAALNVDGQTIHSFFRFKPHITPSQIKEKSRKSNRPTIYEQIEAIVIDEISMVRSDLLDCVDKFLRLNGPKKNIPFGGIQMIFVGDLYQLPPVVTADEKLIFKSNYETPYFFSAHSFDSLEMELIELEKVYRQHDDEFVDLLNSIRYNSVMDEGLELLNRRFMPEFEPAPDDFYIYLTTTNDLASQINTRQLEKLNGETFAFTGAIEGGFGREYLPTAIDLQAKVGAQIMMVNNDSGGRWVNGTIGKILSIQKQKEGGEVIIADLANNEEVNITPHTWVISRYILEGTRLQSEVIGTFTQYPFILAWAVTIHKSQGKTFEKVIIDIGTGTFAHGQMYVALSRCTTLEGIFLKKLIHKHHIRMDYQVVKFLTKYQCDMAEDICQLEKQYPND